MLYVHFVGKAWILVLFLVEFGPCSRNRGVALQISARFELIWSGRVSYSVSLILVNG